MLKVIYPYIYTFTLYHWAGKSTHKNGGKHKMDYILKLLVFLFEDHEEYGPAFLQALTGALQTS